MSETTENRHIECPKKCGRMFTPMGWIVAGAIHLLTCPHDHAALGINAHIAAAASTTKDPKEEE